MSRGLKRTQSVLHDKGDTAISEKFNLAELTVYKAFGGRLRLTGDATCSLGTEPGHPGRGVCACVHACSGRTTGAKGVACVHRT